VELTVLVLAVPVFGGSHIKPIAGIGLGRADRVIIGVLALSIIRRIDMRNMHRPEGRCRPLHRAMAVRASHILAVMTSASEKEERNRGNSKNISHRETSEN